MPPQKDVVLYDWSGYELTLPKAPEASQAEIGRVADKWASVALKDVSPDTLARVAHNTAPLQEHMSLCDKIYNDAHFLSCAEDYTSSIAGLDWDVMPYVDARGAKAKDADKKVAESIGEKLYSAPAFDQYVEHLSWGDGLYPLAGAETIWDLNTYLPARFELVDAVRWTWSQALNELRLLTLAKPREGETLKRANWTLHSRHPQNPRKNRAHKALAFFYMCARMATIDLVSLSEKFGKPIPIAYFEDPNDRDKVVEAVMQIGTEFAGVFPKSVKVELMQALDAKSTIQQGLAQWAYDQVTKLVTGHVLIMEAKSGSGTLGGEGAQKTNLKKTKAGAGRIAGSIKQGLIRPLVWFHHGAKALDRLPSLVFKVTAPEDQEKKAKAYETWQKVLEPSGQMIDSEHIKEAAGVPLLVPRPTAASPAPGKAGDPAQAAGAAATTDAGVATTANAITGIALDKVHGALLDVVTGTLSRGAAIVLIKGAGFSIEDATEMVDSQLADAKPQEKPPAPGKPQNDDQDDPEKTSAAAQRGGLRPAAQAEAAPKIRTLSDVIAASTLVGARAASGQSAGILAAARQAADDGMTVREFQDSLWEDYDETPIDKPAELLAQGMVVAEAIGMGDAAARAGGGE